MDASNIATAANTQAGSLPKDDGKYKWNLYDNQTYISLVTAALLVVDKRVNQDPAVKSRCNSYFEVMSRDRGT